MGTQTTTFRALAIGDGFHYEGKPHRKKSSSTAVRCGTVPRVDKIPLDAVVESASVRAA